MKVFISDKEENYGAYQSQDIDCHKLNFCNNEPMEIVSLEQHEADIRKPLEDEIERLKETIRIIDNDTTDGRVKVLKAYIKKLQQDNNNVWDEYLENAPKINMEEKRTL